MKISGNIIDIVNREIYQGSVYVESGKVKSITREETRNKQYILPGFIDAHIHIESSMVVPYEFAKIALTHGTVATISDPHEIANVLGVLAGRLQNRKSPYTAVFEALIDAAATKPDEKAVEKALKEAAGDKSTLDEIDESWEEQQAFENSLQTTGQDMNAGCPKAEEMLQRMNLGMNESSENKGA